MTAAASRVVAKAMPRSSPDPIAGPVAFLEPATALKALASYNLLTGTSVKLGSILRYPRLSVSACS